MRKVTQHNNVYNYSFIRPSKGLVNAQMVYLALLALPFFINPFLGLILAFIFFSYSSNKENLLIYLALFLAIWISLINVTKEPVSDQYRYMEAYVKAGALPLYYWWEDVSDGSFKEPVFYILTYITHYLFFGNVKLYFFFLSFLNYIILFALIIKFTKAIHVPIIYTLSSILVIAFFTQYFTLTLHIIRQILGASVVCAAIILKAIDGKNRYWLLLISVTLHSSLVFLGVLSLIPWFYRKLTIYRMIVCLIILGTFVVLFGTLGSILLNALGGGGVAYIASRMQDNAVDTVGEMSKMVLIMVYLPLILVSLKLLIYDLPKNRYKLTTIRGISSPFYSIVYIYLVFAAFVLAMSNAPLIQYRFFMMSYIFIPFILPFLLYKTNPLHQVYLLSITVFFICRFILLHEAGPFHYAPLMEIFTMPLPYYF